MDETKEKVDVERKFPAQYIVHCPSGPTYACEEHAKGIQGLMGFMGAHTVVEEVKVIDGKHECMNCKNEAKEKDEESE